MGLTDSRPAQEHLRMLVAIGTPMEEIARVSGINASLLAQLRDSDRRRVTPLTEERVLSVDPSMVPNVVAARAHILTLLDNGWYQLEIARAAKVNRTMISWILSGRQTQAKTHTLERLLALDPTSPPPRR